MSCPAPGLMEAHSLSEDVDHGREYSRESRERAVGLVFEQVSEHASECEAICWSG